MREAIAVLVVTAGTLLLKAAGPLTLGHRELPTAARRVVALMAPALLAGLIVVELGAGGVDWTQLAGVAAAGVAWRLRIPMLLAVIIGAAVAAGLRYW